MNFLYNASIETVAPANTATVRYDSNSGVENDAVGELVFWVCVSEEEGVGAGGVEVGVGVSVEFGVVAVGVCVGVAVGV